MEHGGIFLIRKLAEQGLFNPRRVAQNVQSLVAMAGEHDMVERLGAVAFQARMDALETQLVARCDSRLDWQDRQARHGDDEDLASDVRRYLEMATVDPQRVAREALAELRIDEVVELPEQTLTIDDVPVRRRLSDWLMLRPSASVRSHLLGPREAPATPVPAAIKAKRLGSRARKALQTRLGEVLRPLGQRAIEALPAAILDGYIERFGRRLSESLDEIDAATRAELDGVVRDRDNAETVAVQMRTLREITRPAAEDVAELQRRFQHAAPGALDETPDSSSSPSSPSSP